MRIYKNVQFKTPPVLLASWPGMGNVGIISTDYLRSQLDTKVLAEIDMTQYFIPESIVVRDGLAQLPEVPRSVIYYHEDPDVLIFESNAQVGGKEGIAIIKDIIRFATEYNVQEIYTAAAYAQNISHSSVPQVQGAFNNKKLLEKYTDLGVVPMKDGQIAGLNGLMLGIAHGYNIEAGCFLGTIPSFAANLSYPKASLAIIKYYEEILDITIDTSDLRESIAQVDTQYTEIEKRIRKFYPDAIEEQEERDEDEGWELLEDIGNVEDDEVPQYIMEKIETMFKEVSLDKSKATVLKKELDRWNLFELYESRFLKLFKEE